MTQKPLEFVNYVIHQRAGITTAPTLNAANSHLPAMNAWQTTNALLAPIAHL